VCSRCARNVGFLRVGRADRAADRVGIGDRGVGRSRRPLEENPMRVSRLFRHDLRSKDLPYDWILFAALIGWFLLG